MQDLPQFPESTVQNLLLETNHRCAICGTGCSYEQARIVLCDKSKPYSEENLICLCESCHSKAKNEKWDEPKLREHKKKPWMSQHHNSTELPVQKVSKIQFLIDWEINDFIDRWKQYLISAISAFLVIAPNLVKILSVEQGTIKVTIGIPSSKKKKLLEAGLTEKDELPRYLYPLKILEILDPLRKKKSVSPKKRSEIKSLIDEIVYDPTDKNIDFNVIESIEFKTSDIIQCELTGHIHSKHKFCGANIIRSRLANITARQVDFNRIDFKDCFIKNSIFEESSFEVGGMATSHLTSSVFKQCHFFDSSITDTVFDNVIFERCDLSNLMIKSCRFKECRFINCKTSNKLFEMCLVIDCQFIENEIRNRTITDNFGLKHSDLLSSKIRVAHLKYNSKFLNNNDIENLVKESDLTPLEKFRLSFFLEPHLVMGRDLLDSALDLGTWRKLWKNPGTFGTILEHFSEFLLGLYEKNNLTVHTLLLLHSVTNQLSSSDPPDIQNISFTNLFKTILGVHMILARIVEEYLLVFKLLLQNVCWPLIFLVNGPLDKEYYSKSFPHIFVKSALKIAKIQRRNSPNELHITGSNEQDLSVLLGNYLASRVKDELNRLKNILMNKSQFPLNEAEAINGNQIVPYRVGIAKKDMEIPLLPTEINSKDSFFYQLVLKSIMPGRLLEELHLKESTSKIGKVRSTFLLIPAIEETGESF